MNTHAIGKFNVASWEETPRKDFKGGCRLARAVVKQSFEGGVEGEGVVDYLMTYRPDKNASFVGFLHLQGRVAGRTGSFVLEIIGTFEGGAARGMWTVVPHSGTGELATLRGNGGFEALSGSGASYTLDYEIQADSGSVELHKAA